MDHSPGWRSQISRPELQALVVLLLAISPALVAVFGLPGFVTQDGPAHLYNAEILRASLSSDSPFRDVYEVRWQPLPNWAGHLTLMGLLGVLPPRLADQAMMAMTLAGFAGSILWLRWRVAGSAGLSAAAVLAALLGMNLTWLFGFSSFLLGASLYALTLGHWWSGRDRLGLGWALGMGAWLVLGYFCHPISLGLSGFGMVVLALATPGRRYGRRLAWTLASFVPLVPLALIYRKLMRAGGAIQPVWENLSEPWSLASWRDQLGWVDPLTLGSKAALPFVETRSVVFGLLNPMLWAALGLLIWLVASLRGAAPDHSGPLPSRRGWAWLAAFLIVGGLLAPDTLGPSHGFYLAQRIFLLGLVAALPWFDLTGCRKLARWGTLAIGLAWLVQVGFVWDYARTSNRLTSEFLRAKPHVGRGVRLGALFIDLRGEFRVNPLRHLDCLLGVGTSNIVWSNYETAHYYFPVQVQADVPHPPVLAFEEVSIRDDPKDADQRAALWEQLLAEHHLEIGVLVVRGRDDRLDAITRRWYRLDPGTPDGPTRVWKHRSIEANRTFRDS